MFELFALHAAPIVAKQIGEDLKRAEELLTAHKNKNSILKARDKCIIGSELFIALDKLNHEAQTLSQSQIKKLGKEANQLLNILANINIKDKIPAINAFVTHCTEEIQGKNHTVVSAVLSIAYAAVTAVIAAFIGFGIGCALGAWSGPGAFFSGLAAGVASAVTVVSTASVCGAAALGYSSYHFFKTTPVLSSIKDVAEKTVSTDLLELSF